MGVEGQAGHECVLSIGDVEVGLAKDVTVNFTRDPIDDTARSDAGWKGFVPGLGEWGVSFRMRYDPLNAEFQTLETAFMTGANVADVKMVDKDGYGWEGSVLVSDFSRSEELASPVDITCELKGDGPPVAVTPAS
jgi:predicted secreted protein